jgi:hypothetical protein
MPTLLRQPCYLIPRVVDILKPVSHFAFTLDPEMMREASGEFSDPRFDEENTRAKLPLSTRSGVTRYEAWRLPPADKESEGFVTVAIVTDMTGHGDVFGQIDDEIEGRRQSLERRL